LNDALYRLADAVLGLASWCLVAAVTPSSKLIAPAPKLIT
jgi:hypothetical protein